MGPGLDGSAVIGSFGHMQRVLDRPLAPAW